MMADVRDLYKTAIIDHYSRPRNFREIEGANRRAEGFNSLCGDRFCVYLRIAGGIVEDIGFTGTGCAISTASASMMTDSLKGKTEEEVRIIFERFRQLVNGPVDTQSNAAAMGTLAVFSGLRKYPVRAKCAALAWNTMRAALDEKGEIVKSE
jgi:nitrogen fixation NifU-like protein